LSGQAQSVTQFMPSEKAHLALLDIRHNILAAQRFTGDLSFEQFKNSDLHFYAVTRALEIISEAARRLPDSLLERHASLPWKQITGKGNVLRHNYDNVVETIVWDTVQEHLATLLAVVVAEIDALEGEP
jgi:uncharacterized protein with HEPN domain